MLVTRDGVSPVLSNTILHAQKEVTTVPPAHEDSSLELVRQLCSALKARGIRYCHWKSNAAIDRSASGDNDLDLLVARADVQAFGEVVAGLGFKLAYLQQDKQIPGVLDYYGYDRVSGKLVHLHAHYQLIIGDDATKNYLLPVERGYLDSVTQEGLFPLPSIEFELIIFVVRMNLKHSTWDSMLSFQGKLAKTEAFEYTYLMERADEAKVQRLLREQLPFVTPPLFDRCRQALEPGCPFLFRVQVGQALQGALAAHGRRSQLADTWLKYWRRGSWVIQRHMLKRKTRKRIAVGGAIIAIVGADGSGKSTVVDELSRWLSSTFYTKNVHLGKPKRSLFSLLVKGIAKVGKIAGIVPKKPVTFNPNRATTKRPFPGYFWILWHVLTANDRYHTYIRARRFATNGGLVITDRFPLEQVQSMDGARTGWLNEAYGDRWLVRALVDLEQSYYQNIMAPELLIVLRVNPDTAAQRRADEDADSARARAQEIFDLEWHNTAAYVIDANQDKTEVLAEIKALVWSKL